MRYIISCVAGVAVSLALFLMMTYLIDKHEVLIDPPKVTPHFQTYVEPEPEPADTSPVEPPPKLILQPTFEPPQYPNPTVSPIKLTPPSLVQIAGTDIPTISPQPAVINTMEKPDVTVLVGSKLKYPEIALRRNLEGHVLVENTIDKTGRVIDVKIIESSNFIFEKAARNSVFKWKYTNSELNTRVDRKRIAFKLDN